jgi:hypothetical protein
VNNALHHIRLLAGFEVQPGSTGQRLLDRTACEKLAAALAEDLARVEPEARGALLVVAGSLLEPAELLRPGWPAWEALSDLARPVIREHGASGQLLAIGAHAGRLPDARLRPPEHPPAGQFLAIPILLISEQAIDGLRSRLEEKLFESGGVHPPTKAALAGATAIDVVHGQLLTLADLIALEHVQMDTAGLGGFWPVVEQVLLEPANAVQFDLPAGLEADWNPDRGTVKLRFVSLDQMGASADDYALWVRAFRSLCALLDAHGIDWQVSTDLELDASGGHVTETLGASDVGAVLTEHSHPDCGLIAWSLIDHGRQHNLYPLSSAGMQSLIQQFRSRGLNPQRSTLDASTKSLQSNPSQ